MFIDEEIKLLIQDCSFFHNNGTLVAGVFYLSHTASLVLTNSIFSYNWSPNAGTFFITMGASFHIVGCEFSYNYASDNSAVGLILNNERVG